MALAGLGRPGAGSREREEQHGEGGTAVATGGDGGGRLRAGPRRAWQGAWQRWGRAGCGQGGDENR